MLYKFVTVDVLELVGAVMCISPAPMPPFSHIATIAGMCFEGAIATEIALLQQQRGQQGEGVSE